MTYLLNHLTMDAQKVAAGKKPFYVAGEFTQERRVNDSRFPEVEHILDDIFSNGELR